MKPSLRWIAISALTIIAAAGGWVARDYSSKRTGPGHTSATTNATRRILYYQSAMHPWIKSDQPGRCTICGMELSPVFEGEQALAAREGVITLGSNSVQALHVQTTEVQRRPLVRTLRVAGTLEDNDSRHRVLSAYVDGRIEKLTVNFLGAEVSAGQPLAAFYAPMLLAAEREYRALYQQATASNAAPTLAGTHHELLGAAQQRLRQFGLNDAQIQTIPSRPDTEITTELLAPISGTVVARFVYEGQYVKEGDKLFELSDFSTMWFQFDAYERDLAWLRPGQKVEVSTPSLPGTNLPGVVTFIDPSLNPQTRSAKVRVELPNPLIEEHGWKRRALLNKLYAEAVVQLAGPEVLAVARTAILAPGRHAVAYVDRGGGAYEQRAVKLGRAGDHDWEVLDGLKEGDAVVTTGNLLIDGQAQIHGQPRSADVSPASPATELPALKDAQLVAAREVLSAASVIASALAADNLKDFAVSVAQLPAAVTPFAKSLTGVKAWQPLVTRIEAAAKAPPGGDLPAARQWFHPLAQANADLALAVRRQDPSAPIKIFECPMVDSAVPGAPKKGRWVQMDGPLHNPFFGARMLDCGHEVDH